jgi:hypothetical protein
VADGDGGLRVIDIREPDAPSMAGGCKTLGDASGVAVAGDQVYVADLAGGLTVVDVLDPEYPVVVGNVGTDGSAAGVAVEGGVAYVADGTAGLGAFEICQRTYDASRSIAQSLPLADTRDAVLRARLAAAETDSIAWSLSADGGSHWTPVAPDSTWHEMWTHPGNELLWRAELVYKGGTIAPTVTSLIVEWETATTGVEEQELPARFALHQNMPNPFNPVTRIRYDVPASGGRVRIAVYDVSGRLVRTLVNGAAAPGTRGAVWDGRDEGGTPVASGVYFCRMTAPGRTDIVRIVLLK